MESILRDFDLRSKERVFVGDYEPDMVLGRSLGMLTVGVLTGYKKESELRGAGTDHVISSVGGLVDLLERLGVL